MDQSYELLTNESRFLLAKLYEKYLKNVDSGESRSTANSFGNSHDIHKNIWPKESFDNVDSYAKELAGKNFLNVSYGDDIIWRSSLSNECIAFMQHKLGNNLKKIGKIIFDLSKLLIP